MTQTAGLPSHRSEEHRLADPTGAVDEVHTYVSGPGHGVEDRSQLLIASHEGVVAGCTEAPGELCRVRGLTIWSTIRGCGS